MKIGIVELAFHNEVLRSYINILKDLTNDITCFTNKFCYDQIYDYQDDVAIKWSIKTQTSNKDYFHQIKDEMTACDVVIITTLDDDLDFFSEYDWPTKAILLVHDYYAYFEPSRINYSGTLIEKARATKSWLQYHSKREQKKLNKIMSKMDSLAVPSQAVFDFVSKRDNSKKMEVLDFAIPNGRISSSNNEKAIITIPGNVIPKSRNYLAVIRALKLVIDKLEDTELVILGQAKTSYGRNIIHQLDTLQNEQFSLKYYDSFIHQREFDKQLERADFLLLPISKVMRYRHFKEMNGYTCVSGNINDMLYFGKPAIIPSFYPLDDKVEGIVERYKDENELGQLLVEWVNGKKYLHLNKILPATLAEHRTSVVQRFKKAIS